jgi:hypothetical protein
VRPWSNKVRVPLAVDISNLPVRANCKVVSGTSNCTQSIAKQKARTYDPNQADRIQEVGLSTNTASRMRRCKTASRAQ